MRITILFLLAGISFAAFGQTADSYYHKAAGDYIHEKSNTEVKQTLEEGLRKYPTDTKLNELKKFLKDEEKKKQDQKNKEDKENKEKQEQEKKEQQKKEQEKQKKEQQDKQDQKNKDQKDKQEKEKQEQQKQDQKNDQKKDEKKPDPSLSEKLKDMKITEDKAKMILEAMKNQEVQYLQQNKRKPTKPNDKSKPDW